MPLNYVLQDIKYYKEMVPMYLKRIYPGGFPIMTDDVKKALRFATPDEAESFRSKHLVKYHYRTLSLNRNAVSDQPTK